MKREPDEKEVSEAEQFLFLRTKNESYDDDDEDEWDDSQLIKEYDRAIAKAKQKVIKKLQTEMGLTDAEIIEVFSDSTSEKNRKTKNTKSKKSQVKWTVGSACRATYSEDGEEYEAEIIRLLKNNRCLIRFIGYDNEEKKSRSVLKPSHGKRAIDLQIEDAKLDEEVSEDIMDTEGNTTSGTHSHQSNFRNVIPPHNSNMMDRNVPNFRNVTPPHNSNMMDQNVPNFPHRPPMGHHFPPPPPPPTMVQGPHNQLQEPLMDEALNSMLMSWYMCGFYTGYYQQCMNKY